MATPEPVTAAARQPLTYGAVALSLARRARLLIVSPLVAGVVVAVVALVVPRRYTASTSLVPESRNTGASSQLAGLAALAGVTVGGTNAAQSPQFYTALLRSRAIQYALLQRKFATPGESARSDGDSATLLDLLEVRGKTPGLRLYYGARQLAKATIITSDLKTSIIRLAFTTTSPSLAADVANAYAEELNHFNQETRQLQARARRRFVEQRVQVVGSDLGAAENAMRDFLSRNRQYRDSPALVFEYQRLQRAVDLQQELYLDLRRQLDAARIAEVDDTPTLTTIEPAIPPQLKSWPARKAWVLETMLGVFAALSAVLVLMDYRMTLMPGLVEAYRAAASGLRRRASRSV